MSHLVSVSSSGYLSTTFMISRHTKPMLSIFLSPIFFLQNEILNYGHETIGHDVTLFRAGTGERLSLSERESVNTDTKSNGFYRVWPKVSARAERARRFPIFTECSRNCVVRYVFVVSSKLPLLFKYLNVHMI